MPAPLERDLHTPPGLTGRDFLRRFRWRIFHAWGIPPVFGLGFILLIGVLTPQQVLGILTTPLEPAYILGWLAFAVWYLPRRMQPVADWLDGRPDSSPEAALAAVRRFPLLFWGIFLVYLVLAPASVILSAELYTDYVASPYDGFRIELVALIVSIIVGLPIFFLIFDLFGRALGSQQLRQPIVTIRTRVFLIGALVPLLIDTMLVQYYWTRTGYFNLETFGVWLLLEALAIGGSLIFAHSFGQSLQPLQTLIGANRPLPPQRIAALRAQSTDELGVLAADYRILLEELQLQGEILELNNRLLRSAGGDSGTAAVFNEVVALCHQAVHADQAFVIVLDRAANELVGVAQTGDEYRPEGHYRLALDEPSLAVWAFRQGRTVAVEDAASDPRVSPRMMQKFQVKSALAAPMRLDGDTTGVLMAVSRQTTRTYTAREIALMEGLAREAAYAFHAQQLRQAQIRAEAARLEQEQQVRLLMDATEEGIYGVDLEGRCTFVNRAALAMLGYLKPEDLLGRNLHELVHHTHPDGRPYPKQDCRVRLATLAGRSAHADDELHWRADGTGFPVEYWSRPIVREGETIGTVVSFVDITARKAAEAELQRYRHHLEELVEHRTRDLEAFSYSVSHDLRAPLRAIDGFSQACLEDCSSQLDDTGRGHLRRIRAAAQRMSGLIDDLLNLSRVSRCPMRHEQVDLSALARDILAGLREAHPGRQVAVRLQEGLRAEGDPGLLRSVLDNLIGNAWKYTARTQEARIEFGSRTQAGETAYFVRDNGAGFDMRYADKLFGAFQRLHSASEFEGTGVGLAIVQRIIHRHGGRVWAEGEPGRGASFYFTLGQAQAANRP